MKLFLCFSMLVLHVFGKPPLERSVAYEEFDAYRLSQSQQALLDGLVDVLGGVLKSHNNEHSYEIPLDQADPPAVQNFTDTFDEGFGGTLYFYDSVIDGLSKLTDRVDITTENLKIQIKAKLKKLNIRGEYTIEGYSGEDESGSFDVLLSNVMIHAQVSLLRDPHGNIVINKITPVILSENTYVTMKSALISHDSLVRSALRFVEQTIRNRLVRVATIEMLFRYPRVAPNLSSKLNRLNFTLFEARRYVDHGYNPYKMKMQAMSGSSTMWRMGPFNLHGFGNFFVDELDLMVNANGTAIDVITRVIASDLYGKFPFTLGQRNVGDYTVGKIEFIAKLVIPALKEAGSPPHLQTLQLQLTNCNTEVRDRASGQIVNNEEFGFDIDGLFCLLLKNEIPTQGIVDQIQNDILNRMDMKSLRAQIGRVIEEDRLASANS